MNPKLQQEIRDLHKWMIENNPYSQEAWVAIANTLEALDDNCYVSDVYKFIKLLSEKGFKVVPK